jgi:2-keto-4-pentenoate hydratase/2-oxohepta-3-ene-1,7-dioic acid hydratase in catechol pathway
MTMASYKLVTYAGAEGPRAGAVIGERVCDAAKLTGHAADATTLSILADWPAANERLTKAAGSPGTGMPLASTRLLAPIGWPSAVYCAGANYGDHAAEMARANNRPPEPDPHALGLKPFSRPAAARSRRTATPSGFPACRRPWIGRSSLLP